MRGANGICVNTHCIVDDLFVGYVEKHVGQIRCNVTQFWEKDKR
jgi:hypothetical protein